MYLSLFCFCACALGLTLADFEPFKLEDAEHHFERFIIEHERSYAHEYEKKMRLKIFKDNLEKANELNQKSGRAIFGITPFSDLTNEEFARDYTGLQMPSEDEDFCELYDSLPENYDGEVSESLDWRDCDAVTPVKDQGPCGSCYAFSAIGNIESQYAIKTNKSVVLSEQQIVDCDKTNLGCCAGLASRAFKNLIQQGGPQTDKDYPYVGKVQNCKFDERMIRVRLAGCQSYNLTCQHHVEQLLYYYGPISIAIKATKLHLYTGGKGGIIDDEICDVGEIDHAVLLVGYGEEEGKPYWIVKNSWGQKWGEQGYFRMQRGPHAQSCGMMNEFMATSTIE